ncbi:MAG: SDR family oxidoreductase [bacterium]
MGRLSNKVVLVTGATSGIGIDIARRCVEEGAKVAAAGRNAERGEAVAAELGDNAVFVQLDVSSEDSWQATMQKIVDTFGRLDVLVNNAGVMTPCDVENTSVDLFRDTIMTNAGGVFMGCKLAIAQMKTQNAPASLVNVLSTTALKTSAWTLAYGASKAAALSVTKSIALHCAQAGYDIRCNAVLPGVVMTPMVENVLNASPDREATLAALVADHPIGRLMTGTEVANAVIYYASEESSGVTGSHFAVDGGQTATGW